MSNAAKLCVCSALKWTTGCSTKATPADATTAVSSPAVENSFDVAVYGGTPSGIMAARAASREGLKVALIETTANLGGILTNGFSGTDAGLPQSIGGLTRQFYSDLGKYYGTSTAYYFESKVAETLFNQYLSSANVEVYLDAHLASIQMALSKDHVASIVLSNGTVISAMQWIDASYEGDLMAACDVKYVVGREAKTEFNESAAGFGVGGSSLTIPVSTNGQRLTYVGPYPNERSGAADHRIMGYSFRSCLTNVKQNMVPFPKPDGYDPSDFAGLARSISVNRYTSLGQLVVIQPLIRNKYTFFRSLDPFSVNYTGGNYEYPDADWSRRQEILKDHYKYVAGWLYYVANDPTVPSSIQRELQQYGLAKDEFVGNDNWPWQMYVREARRMRGQYVMTQADLSTDTTKHDSIALGQWGIDIHYCSLYENAIGNVAFEGLAAFGKGGYQIPYRVMLPEESQVTNLAVTCALSATHVAFGSLRVEPVFMQLGEAAGVAAAICVRTNSIYSKLEITALQQKLTGYGAILSS